jgi:hypothetical protein
MLNLKKGDHMLRKKHLTLVIGGKDPRFQESGHGTLSDDDLACMLAEDILVQHAKFNKQKLDIIVENDEHIIMLDEVNIGKSSDRSEALKLAVINASQSYKKAGQS